MDYYDKVPVTVTFDATTNGGTMPLDWVSPTYYGGARYGTLPTPTKEGEMFVGWYDGSTKVNVQSIVPTTGATLVAQYA